MHGFETYKLTNFATYMKMTLGTEYVLHDSHESYCDLHVCKQKNELRQYS